MAEMALARGGSPGTRARQPPGMESARRRSVWPAPLGGRDPSAAWAHLPAPGPARPSYNGAAVQPVIILRGHDCHQAMGSFSLGLGRQGTKDTDPVLAPAAPRGGRGGSEGPAPHQGECMQVPEETPLPGLFLKSGSEETARGESGRWLFLRGSGAGLTEATGLWDKRHTVVHANIN